MGDLFLAESLSAAFSVWPATARELLDLSRYWNGEDVPQPVFSGRRRLKGGGSQDWLPHSGRWTPARLWREVTNESARSLEGDLGEGAFRWLCACAHYPELHWDLTMRLAQMPEIGGADGTAAKDPDRLRLFSLDWFRQGFIPRQWCEVLVTKLGSGVSDRVREVIGEEIAPIKVKSDSDAGQLQRLWVEFQKLWPDRESIKGLRRMREWARAKISFPYVIPTT